jgi:hypothetical protein
VEVDVLAKHVERLLAASATDKAAVTGRAQEGDGAGT